MRYLLLLVLTLSFFPAFAATSDALREGDLQPEIVTIGRMPSPPALDGKLTDWPADATTFLLGQSADTVRRFFAWSGTRDLGGAMRLAWDEQYLYLAADVSDDRVQQAKTPAEIWQGDTLELFFNIHPREQRVDGFWQLAVVPPLTPEATTGTLCPQKDFTGVEGAAQSRPGGYTFECRIPWQNLTGFTPTTGTYLGFQLYLDDRDGTGRKSQLVWYPSAITFSRPTHTNVLILREHGQTNLPQVLAGPTTWCVTNPRTMNVSVISDTPGATTAKFAAVAPSVDTPDRLPAPITIPLQSAGERISTGQGAMDVSGLEGLYTFAVTVTDAQGKVLATNTSQAQLVGERFVGMLAHYAALRTRIDALQTRTDRDATAIAGLAAWLKRVNAFISNEAKPETLNRDLLDQMISEMTAIEKAATSLEAGNDPYADQRGSIIRAYRSPLTGKYWQYALYVPANYNPETGAPLIVMLHSIFGDERILAGMARQFTDLGAIVYQGAAYRQFDWGGVSAAETWAGLDDVKSHYRIDEDRVYLIGCHIGGRGTWQLAEGRPDLWAAIAPIYSGIDTKPNYPALRLYPQYYQEAVNVHIPAPQFKLPAQPSALTNPLEQKMLERASLVPFIENIAQLPIRSAYGEDDPDAAAERLAMQQRLVELDAPLQTHYAPGAMHGSSPEEYRDPEFYRWLLSHRRSAYPKQVHFSVANLRYNTAWWVRVDGLTSPAEIGRIDAEVSDNLLTVNTENLSALTLTIDKRLAAVGATLAVAIDGQAQKAVTIGEEPINLSLTRRNGGRWQPGTPTAGKHRGLSGPIDDFQFGRFLYVYGTQGDAQNPPLEKIAKRLADWGLGAIFEVKADTEVTADDLRDATLLLLGTPRTNLLLAKMANRLPLQWLETGLRIGDATVGGPGIGACMIYPNPLAPERYAVVITAVDEAGYQVWNARNPGGDYVLGIAAPVNGKPVFTTVMRGWFDNQWKWTKELAIHAQ